MLAQQATGAAWLRRHAGAFSLPRQAKMQRMQLKRGNSSSCNTNQVTDALQQQQVDRRDGRLDGAEAAQGARPGRSSADRARAPPGRSRGEWQQRGAGVAHSILRQLQQNSARERSAEAAAARATAEADTACHRRWRTQAWRRPPRA